MIIWTPQDLRFLKKAGIAPHCEIPSYFVYATEEQIEQEERAERKRQRDEFWGRFWDALGWGCFIALLVLAWRVE